MSSFFTEVADIYKRIKAKQQQKYLLLTLLCFFVVINIFKDAETCSVVNSIDNTLSWIPEPIILHQRL